MDGLCACNVWINWANESHGMSMTVTMPMTMSVSMSRRRVYWRFLLLRPAVAYLRDFILLVLLREVGEVAVS